MYCLLSILLHNYDMAVNSSSGFYFIHLRKCGNVFSEMTKYLPTLMNVISSQPTRWSSAHAYTHSHTIKCLFFYLFSSWLIIMKPSLFCAVIFKKIKNKIYTALLLFKSNISSTLLLSVRRRGLKIQLVIKSHRFISDLDHALVLNNPSLRFPQSSKRPYFSNHIVWHNKKGEL